MSHTMDSFDGSFKDAFQTEYLTCTDTKSIHFKFSQFTDLNNGEIVSYSRSLSMLFCQAGLIV